MLGQSEGTVLPSWKRCVSEGFTWIDISCSVIAELLGAHALAVRFAARDSRQEED